MDYVDTHCHIQSADQASTLTAEEGTRHLWEKAGFPGGDTLIERAQSVGVNRMVCVGCDLADSQLAVQFVANRPQCWASIGLHPHEAQHYHANGVSNKSKLQAFTDLASSPKVVAIGECGLDYFYEHSSRQDQAAVLHFQFQIAQKHGLPMIFHVREAFDDFWPIFEQYHTPDRPIRGVVHSFTDTAANLDKALKYGLSIGVNGIATFTKSQAQQAMYKSIPLSRLLLETDSPFLTPSPYRGNICEPYHISVVAEFLAKLRDEPLEQLAASTTVNARELFNL